MKKSRQNPQTCFATKINAMITSLDRRIKRAITHRTAIEQMISPIPKLYNNILQIFFFIFDD